MEQKPKTAYELLMEKQRMHPVVTVWFTEEMCPECEAPIYTDGKTRWCKRECPKDDRVDCRTPGTYAGLQEDYIR